MIMAMGPAIIARTFDPGERGKALGLNAVSVSIGLSLGPALGGLLTELGSWRAIFLVNVPVGIFAIAWAARILPADRPGRASTSTSRGPRSPPGPLRPPARPQPGRAVGLDEPADPRRCWRSRHRAGRRVRGRGAPDGGTR